MTIINPKRVLDLGILRLPKNVDVNQVLQPNGIDLQIESVRLISGHRMLLGDNIKTKHLGSEDVPLELIDIGAEESVQGYKLCQGHQYQMETGYEIELPSDMAAYIFTRSSLNRNGILVGSGLWDSGYHGLVGTTLYAYQDVALIPPVRIAQIIFLKAESAHLYEGTYNIAAIKQK